MGDRGCGVLAYPHRGSEDLTDTLLSEHRLGRALGEHRAFLEQNQAVEEQRRQVQIVDGGDDGDPLLPVECPQTIGNQPVVSIAQTAQAPCRRTDSPD